jgi:chromosome segregation ATPase
VNAGVWDPRLILQASLLSLTFGAIEDGLPAEGLGHLKSLLHLLPSDPQGAVADVLEAPAGASGDPLLRARLHALQVDLARHERERRRLAEEVGAGDDDAGRMVRHVRETGARLADRERELAALRADRESLARACGLPEDADTATVGERVLALQARAAAEEARAARLAADRDLIRREVGASEPAEVVGLVAGLRARVARLEREQTAITADRDLLRNLCGIPAGGAADDDVLRSVAAHVRDLRDAVAERDEQVCELRALRERLIEEVGTADPDGIAEEVRALRANLARALQGVAGLLGDLEGGLSAGAAPLPPLPASLTGGNGGDNKR